MPIWSYCILGLQLIILVAVLSVRRVVMTVKELIAKVETEASRIASQFNPGVGNADVLSAEDQSAADAAVAHLEAIGSPAQPL